MTKDEARRQIYLMFDYHFIYSKELSDSKPFEGSLKDTICDMQNRLEELLDIIFNDFNESQEGLRYTYEETITGLIGANND